LRKVQLMRILAVSHHPASCIQKLVSHSSHYLQCCLTLDELWKKTCLWEILHCWSRACFEYKWSHNKVVIVMKPAAGTSTWYWIPYKTRSSYFFTLWKSNEWWYFVTLRKPYPYLSFKNVSQVDEWIPYFLKMTILVLPISEHSTFHHQYKNTIVTTGQFLLLLCQFCSLLPYWLCCKVK